MISSSAHVSRETHAKLGIFVDLLLQWNTTVNLIGPGTVDDVWARHIDDSLSLAPCLHAGERALDLGSGAGFPGLILSIATGVDFLLVEADLRKATFLREAIRHTGARARVHAERAESLTGVRFDIITARAFAPLARLITLSQHLLDLNGRYLLLKSARMATEVADAERCHDFSIVTTAGTPPGVLELRLKGRN